MMEYAVFDRLCKEKNVRPADVSKETGISKTTFSAWKAGTYSPKLDKMQKIADYFNVSIDYLAGNEFLEMQSKDPVKDQMIRIFETLSPDDQKLVLELALKFSKDKR
jgi:transcriptional regulator with XRE-family HTH domain